MTRRDLCPADRRGVYSVITDEGRTCLAEATPTYERSLAVALEQADGDPALSQLVLAVRG